MIWVPYTKTNGQWIASKILQGFFGAPVESLCEISVTDLVSILPFYIIFFFILEVSGSEE